MKCQAQRINKEKNAHYVDFPLLKKKKKPSSMCYVNEPSLHWIDQSFQLQTYSHYFVSYFFTSSVFLEIYSFALNYAFCHIIDSSTHSALLQQSHHIIESIDNISFSFLIFSEFFFSFLSCLTHYRFVSFIDIFQLTNVWSH